MNHFHYKIVLPFRSAAEAEAAEAKVRDEILDRREIPPEVVQVRTSCLSRLYSYHVTIEVHPDHPHLIPSIALQLSNLGLF